MGKNAYVNLNGVCFNVICNDDETLQRVKYVFDGMFSDYYSFYINKFKDYTIHFNNDPIEYSKMRSKLIDIRVERIDPNIYGYVYNGLNIYHHYSGFYVYEFCDEYYVVANNSKYAPYYLMLELYLKTCEEKKNYIFHGNSIKLDDIGFNIIGSSHSGKTTLMSKLFQISDINKAFLSNDRILVGSDCTLYFPIEINLDKNTISNDKNLRKKLETNKPKTYVKPTTFVSCYSGLKYVSNVKNNCFLIPKIDLLSKDSISVEEMSKEEAAKTLSYCCFSIKDRECERGDWIIDSKSLFQREKEISTLIDYLGNEYKFLSVRYGCDLEGERIYEKIRKKN